MILSQIINPETILTSGNHVIDLLKRFDLYDDFNEGNTKCFFCKSKLNAENLSHFFYRFEPRLVCKDNECQTWLKRYTIFP